MPNPFNINKYELADAGYWVSRDGDVFGKYKKMKHQVCKLGYHRVCLFINGKRITIGVHRLVAIMYISAKVPSTLDVNHIDGDKSNNTVKNLEWVTHAENMNHAANSPNIQMGAPRKVNK